jgi:hypothetical protein
MPSAFKLLPASSNHRHEQKFLSGRSQRNGFSNLCNQKSSLGVVAVTSAANRDRILFGQEWLKNKTPAEEVLIIGSTLAGANEITRSLIREKRAAFGSPAELGPVRLDVGTTFASRATDSSTCGTGCSSSRQSRDK